MIVYAVTDFMQVAVQLVRGFSLTAEQGKMLLVRSTLRVIATVQKQVAVVVSVQSVQNPCEV